MIRRLEISGLVVIEHAALDLAPGLTAVTGETGAGKSVFMQALGLLAGDATDPGLVRPGHAHALVQATIGLPAGFWDALPPDDPASGLRELADDESEVVVARRIPAEGRARASLDGQVASREAVGALVRHAVRFSGQGEQYQLVSPRVQLGIVDAFAGPTAIADARSLRTLRDRLADIERRQAEVARRRADTQGHLDALTALVGDVDALAGTPDELTELRRRRDRMRNADALRLAAGSSAEALSPAGGDGGARDQVGQALGALEPYADGDADLAGIVEQLVTASELVQDAGSALRAYVDGIDADPVRLEAVEDRISAYVEVERRHGADVGTLIGRADAARAELDAARADLSDTALAEQHAAVLAEARAVADRLHTVRANAVPKLSRAVDAELAGLAMGEAALRVELTRDDQPVPADGCVFWFRANPGLPESRLADAASGGELSRVLLALHAVARDADGSTWVFDEIDAGIGGTTASAVAARLARMGEATQVLVITHLPAVAAAAAARLRLVKSVAGGTTTTAVEPLEGDAVEDELVRMLGGEAGGTREHARELLQRWAHA